MTLASLIIVLINVCVVSHAAPQCAQGSYFDGEQCSLCPPGTYRDRYSRTNDRCTPCPAGTFTPHYGVGVEDLCWRCPPNYYSQENATSCTPCPAGLVSTRGSDTCVACKPGTYPAFNYAAGTVLVCSDCKPGTYRDNIKDTVCTECPFGHLSKKGSKSISDCYECPAGTYKTEGENPNICEPCYPGSFNPKPAQDFCPYCPRGFIAPKSGATKCKPCPIGMIPSSSRQKCWPCAEGSTTYSKGQSVCRKIGQSCPASTVEGPTGDCLKCDTGYYLSDSFECTECPFGTRGLGGKARSCIKCPDRQYSPLGFGPCRCPGGEYVSSTGSCSKCPRGTDLRADLYDGKICNECGEKNIAPKPGTALCQRCLGYLVANEKRTKCVECEPGFVIDDPFTELPVDDVYLHFGSGYCLNITTGCVAGYIRKGRFRWQCAVQHCAIDTPPEQIGKTCFPCEKGYALLKEGKGCTQCPLTQVSDGGIITECRECPNGLHRDLYDGSLCACVRNGYGMQNGTCAKCPPGYITGNFLEGGVNTCTACGPGEYTNRAGQPHCHSCAQNYFKANAGPGKCKKCPEGFVGNQMYASDKCVKI